MKAKKINAVLALLITLLLVDHTIACGTHLLTHDFSSSMPMPSYALMVLVIIHAIVSIFFVFVRHDSKFVKYTKQNVRTIIQRDSGFLMLIAIGFHVYSATAMPNVSFTLLYIAHLAVVLFSMLHTAVSVPNALITLGIITSEKKYKITSIICSVICFLLFVYGAAGSVMEVF